MDFSTLQGFRRQTYACFERAADALMNAADAPVIFRGMSRVWAYRTLHATG
jgi:hypothetical protein